MAERRHAGRREKPERKKERKQTTKRKKEIRQTREGWEDGTPPPHRDFRQTDRKKENKQTPG